MPSLLMPLAGPTALAGAEAAANPRTAGAEAAAPGAFAQALRRSNDSLRPDPSSPRATGPATGAGVDGDTPAGATSGPSGTDAAAPSGGETADNSALDEAGDTPRSRGRSALRRSDSRRGGPAPGATGPGTAPGTGQADTSSEALGGGSAGSTLVTGGPEEQLHDAEAGDPGTPGGLADGPAGTAAAPATPLAWPLAGTAPSPGGDSAAAAQGAAAGPAAAAGALAGSTGLARDERPTARRWPLAAADAMSADAAGRAEIAQRGAGPGGGQPAGHITAQPATADRRASRSAAGSEALAAGTGPAAASAGAPAGDLASTPASTPASSPGIGPTSGSAGEAITDPLASLAAGPGGVPAGSAAPEASAAASALPLQASTLQAPASAGASASLALQGGRDPGADSVAAAGSGLPTGQRRALAADSGLADPGRRMSARPLAAFVSAGPAEAAGAAPGVRRSETSPLGGNPPSADSGRRRADAASTGGPAAESAAGAAHRLAGAQREGPGADAGRGGQGQNPQGDGQARAGEAAHVTSTGPAGSARSASDTSTESFQQVLAPALAQAGGPATPLAQAAGSPDPGPVLQLPTPLHSPDFPPALGAQISWLTRAGVHEARLELNPAEMGPVSVRIVVQGGGTQVDFQAEQAATRQVIESSLPALAGALRDAGLTLTGGGVFDTTAANTGFGGQTAAGGQGGQQAPSGGAEGQAGQRGGSLPGDGRRGATEAFERSAVPARPLPSQRGLVDLVA